VPAQPGSAEVGVVVISPLNNRVEHSYGFVGR
jgi:hypothetical protein